MGGGWEGRVVGGEVVGSCGGEGTWVVGREEGGVAGGKGWRGVGSLQD